MLRSVKADSQACFRTRPCRRTLTPKTPRLVKGGLSSEPRSALFLTNHRSFADVTGIISAIQH